MMRHFNKARVLFFSTGVIIILAGLFYSYKEPKSSEFNENNNKDNPKRNYAIFSIDTPEKLDFAGESVPVDQIDIREALDREILTNTYWQSQTFLFIKRANRFFPVIESVLNKYGVPSDFKYLPIAESGLLNIISPAKATGYWQFLESTAREYGLEVNSEIDERYHIEKSTEAACKFILESYNKYGSWTMAAASYNAGRKGLNTQINRQKETHYYDLLLAEETSRYIFRILSFKLIISNPSDYGFYFEPDDLYPEIPTYDVSVEGEVKDFAEFAKRYGISYKVLKLLNPWLREAFLTNKEGKTYYIKIPRDGYFKINSLNKAE